MGSVCVCGWVGARIWFAFLFSLSHDPDDDRSVWLEEHGMAPSRLTVVRLLGDVVAAVILVASAAGFGMHLGFRMPSIL